MTDNFFHGARTKENTDLQTVINDVDSTVIGPWRLLRMPIPKLFHLIHRC